MTVNRFTTHWMDCREVFLFAAGDDGDDAELYPRAAGMTKVFDPATGLYHPAIMRYNAELREGAVIMEASA